MPYKVQFVGLAFFQEDPPGTLRVMLPDGRKFETPAGAVPPHLFSISVAPDAVIAHKGWAPDEVEIDKFHTQFWPPPSAVTIGGCDSPGKLDTDHQVPRLPTLMPVNPNVKIDPEKAKTVGDITIRQGLFKVSLMPGKPVDAARVSTMDVAYNGKITITLTEKADPLNPAAPGPKPAVRTIQLRAGTEIVLVNTSRGDMAFNEADVDHSAIYAQLCATPVALIPPEIDSAALSPLKSRHPFFSAPNAAITGAHCSPATSHT